MNGVGRETRRDRSRSGSVVSMASMSSMVSTPGFGVAGLGDPHRETELSVATDNLSLEEIDGNVFRMSKDQVNEHEKKQRVYFRLVLFASQPLSLARNYGREGSRRHRQGKSALCVFWPNWLL